jgi:hypothetical protein
MARQAEGDMTPLAACPGLIVLAHIHLDRFAFTARSPSKGEICTVVHVNR